MTAIGFPSGFHWHAACEVEQNIEWLVIPMIGEDFNLLLIKLTRRGSANDFCLNF